MNHLILTTDFTPMVGGIAQYLHGLARALSEHGHVQVFAYGINACETFDPPYEVCYETKGTDRQLGERYGDGFPVTRKLNSFLYYRELRTDAIQALERHVNLIPNSGQRVYVGVWSHTAHWWCSYLQERDVPYRLFTYGRELQRPLSSLWRRWRAEDFRWAEVIYACSKATASLVKRKYPDVEVCAVHPGISEPQDTAGINRAASQLKRHLEIASHEQVLVTVGRLVQRKGVDRVIKSLASDRMRNLDIRYIVAGSGPERGRLEELREELDLCERVHFLGFVDEQMKWAVYQLGDVFVMPNSDLDDSDWEGFGIVFLEAAIMGLPAVAGRSGGAVEAVEHGRTGLLVDPDSNAQLREALVRLAGDRRLRCQLGRNARERAFGQFSWERAAETVLADAKL